MQSSALGPVGQQGQQTTTGYDAFSNVQLEEFIKLLVAELSNQDPMNPMDNNEILQQISQMREIESNQRLTETLESVLLGQSLTTANSLLGRTIRGLDDEANEVTGTVERVSIEEGKVKAHVGEHVVSLNNVAEVVPEGYEFPAEDDRESGGEEG